MHNTFVRGDQWAIVAIRCMF
ncbi:hypothetical protein Gotur_002892 [Gossypium turneri]